MENENSKEAERSLVIIKPGNFGYCLEIFECLHDSLGDFPGFSRTLPSHVFKISEAIIREHYSNIANLPIYDVTVKAFLHSEDGIVLSVYSGESIIKRIRYAIGNTDPQKAESGTIRNIFSKDSLELAFNERRYLNNVIHASSSIEDAEREIRLWRDYL